jgi:segregation and condensation protein B
MTDSPEFASDAEPILEPGIAGEGWSGAEIEEAYLKALHAMEDVAWQEESPAGEGAEAPVAPLPADAPASDEAPVAGATGSNDAAPGSTGEASLPSPRGVAPPEAAPADGPRLAQGTIRPDPVTTEQASNVTPAQVIEAALFVGGGPLTARKISGLLRGSYGPKEVEQAIDEMNDAYVAQSRPYEIRLGDGGYRLELRPEYDRLRHRVYGSGPREVRLSQDVLEVLALVAYRQPISEEEIAELGKQNAGNLLRQLLRRDLIAFERGPGGRKDLRYHTTARFLSVFGLGSLDELPQAEDLARK